MPHTSGPIGQVTAKIFDGLLDPIDTGKLPQFADLVPQFTSQSAIHAGDKLLGVPWNWGSLPLMYDPAAVSGVPESWLDILKPEYKGKVAMVDDPLGNLLIWGTVVTDKPMGTILTKRLTVPTATRTLPELAPATWTDDAASPPRR